MVLGNDGKMYSLPNIDLLSVKLLLGTLDGIALAEPALQKFYLTHRTRSRVFKTKSLAALMTTQG